MLSTLPLSIVLSLYFFYSGCACSPGLLAAQILSKISRLARRRGLINTADWQHMVSRGFEGFSGFCSFAFDLGFCYFVWVCRLLFGFATRVRNTHTLIHIRIRECGTARNKIHLLLSVCACLLWLFLFFFFFLLINISFDFAICLLLYFPSPRLQLSSSLSPVCVRVCGWPISDHDLYDPFAGAYGTVYRALDNLTGRYVAIKKVRIPLTDNGVSASTLREISLLKQLNTYEHANVVRWVEQRVQCTLSGVVGCTRVVEECVPACVWVLI